MIPELKFLTTMLCDYDSPIEDSRILLKGPVHDRKLFSNKFWGLLACHQSKFLFLFLFLFAALRRHLSFLQESDLPDVKKINTPPIKGSKMTKDQGPVSTRNCSRTVVIQTQGEVRKE